jgi:transposase InsO family protein
MLESVERCFGLVDRLPVPIEWLSDNGSPYTARKTRALAGEIGLVPRPTPIESPQAPSEYFTQHRDADGQGRTRGERCREARGRPAPERRG